MKYLIPILLLLVSCVKQEKRFSTEYEYSHAIVLSEGEIEEFNLAGSVVGYYVGKSVFGGSSGGLIGGALGSQMNKECKIPVRIEGEPKLLTTKSELLCRASIAGDSIAVKRSITYKINNKTKEKEPFMNNDWYINRE